MVLSFLVFSNYKDTLTYLLREITELMLHQRSHDYFTNGVRLIPGRPYNAILQH